MFKNTASKIELFAFDVTTGAPKTADAANLTASVSKDHGASTDLADTSATELDSTKAKGVYQFDVTAAETNGDDLLFTGRSTTANVSIVPLRVTTIPGLSPVTGTARAGSTSSNLNLAASTTAAQCPPGAIVAIIAGTGAGQVNKRDSTAVSGAGGSTPAATFVQAWAIATPDGTSVYLVLPSDGIVPQAVLVNSDGYVKSHMMMMSKNNRYCWGDGTSLSPFTGSAIP